MKILITPQFNKVMDRLNKTSQQEVVRLYNFLSVVNKEDLIASPLITKITSEDDSIFTLRGKTIRIFCTFNISETGDEVIFLDVSEAKDIHFRTPKKGSETTIFNKNGAPQAYITHSDENVIYSFNGEPMAYIDENNNIYGFNGRHLGWFEDDIVWDHQGLRVGFTKSTCPVHTQFEPFKGFKQFKPLKSFKQFVPVKPVKGYGISAITTLDFFKAGRC